MLLAWIESATAKKALRPGAKRVAAPRRRAAQSSLLVLLLALVAGCADLDAVRDFSKSAAAVSSYPLAGTAYLDSAVTSAPYLLPPTAAASAAPAAPDLPLVPAAASLRTQRQQQVAAALDLQAALGDYFLMLARLAGDDLTTVATAKALDSDARSISAGKLNRTTLDAYANLIKTLGDFALVPARERAVKELVRSGGPDAMRILAALRSVAADWRAEVANDARQIDTTLGVAAMASDVTPLLRVLAYDRKAELGREYAVTLRKMGSIDRSLDAVAHAHAEMVLHLDDLQDPQLRARLKAAAAELRASGETLVSLR